MWLVLACYISCGTPEDAGAVARAQGWREDLAVAGMPYPGGGSHQQWRANWLDSPEDFEELPERFSSQRECLRALRRALPEIDEGSHGDVDEPWGFNYVIHGPDYVDWGFGAGMRQGAGMMRSGTFACFQEAPRIS
jgi:hypothetical protein